MATRARLAIPLGGKVRPAKKNVLPQPETTIGVTQASSVRTHQDRQLLIFNLKPHQRKQRGGPSECPSIANHRHEPMEPHIVLTGTRKSRLADLLDPSPRSMSRHRHMLAHAENANACPRHPRHQQGSPRVDDMAVHVPSLQSLKATLSKSQEQQIGIA
jgi:hypothetical protein